MNNPLFKLMTVKEGLQVFRNSFDYKNYFALHQEKIELISASKRVLAEDIIAKENIPGFNRATVDGYALKAGDTFGASDGLPAYLEVIGEIRMSEIPSLLVCSGQTARISTGGMLPEGADAVVMLEYTEQIDETMIEANRPVALWENVLRADEDIKKGEILLKKGQLLRPQDIGLLAALGWGTVLVYKKPGVAIISTGDEIVPVHSQPKPGQVRDINLYALGASVEEIGAIPHYREIIPDDELALEKELQKCIESDEIDMVLISGGSSVGSRDYTLKVLNHLGSPGVLVHGLALKPGKPTIISLNNQKPIIGLPGHPVSTLIVFESIVKKILSDLKGEILPLGLNRTVEALLENNIASEGGREEFIRVILKKKDGKFWAVPVLGKSGMISTLAKADGYIVIGLNQEGLYQGDLVTVYLF
ncbi:MAG TPA: molybdopterin molybdotransferase MoeA [Atribacterota bacterium]|nr:molybdopterin molybdotransferase MoeA [Atribacterota bacterium]